ncbi:MAG: hypothetical protein WCV91_02895 [Candidatus Margulisiibacteriota bacterium]
MTNPSPEELNSYVSTLENAFNNSMLSDINIAMKGNANLGALILMLCAIDCLKTYRYGVEAIDMITFNKLKGLYPGDTRLEGKITGPNSKYYISFLKEYLLPLNSNYNVEYIYIGLRCGLIHSYTENIFDNNRSLFQIVRSTMKQNISQLKKEIIHLQTKINNNPIFILDEFYQDFKNACNAFFVCAKTDEKIKINIFEVKSFLGIFESKHIFD